MSEAPGRTPTVLALHGQPGTGRDFEALARAREGAGTVLAPDRPGWGSRAGEAAGGFASGAEDALRVLDRAGVDRAVVLGFSWAGGVALELARRHPARVSGLVLAASIGPGEPSLVDKLLALPVFGRTICAGGFAASRLALRRPAVHGLVAGGMKAVEPDHVRHFADHCLSRAALASFMVEQRALVAELPAVLEGLRTVRVPAVVLSGERDRLIAAGSARGLVAALPGAELRIVPGAGHFLPGAAPDALAAAVVDVGSTGPPSR